LSIIKPNAINLVHISTMKIQLNIESNCAIIRAVVGEYEYEYVSIASLRLLKAITAYTIISQGLDLHAFKHIILS
jgi:hypothetical protein